MKAALLASAALFSLVPGAAAMAAGQPVVVELFTSQSCSSCPPADALLAELKASRTDILPLDFHVDYWNNLGWHDPYSSVAATQRQRDYSAKLGVDGVYTPQIVVGGKRQMVGSERSAVVQAINAAVGEETAPVALGISRTGAGVTVDAGAGKGSATLWLVGYDSSHMTSVGGGENTGRSLREVNVVRSIMSLGDWNGASHRFDAAVPAGEHIAALLQAPDGSFIAAASDG